MRERQTQCTHCMHVITGKKNCYSGSCYCSDCFTLVSSLKLCTSCNKKRRILDKISPPVCQKCRHKVTPCIRCKKTNYSIGKITEIGPVCNSCSPYFRLKKQCTRCNKLKIGVTNRNMKDGSELVCGSCYNKTLPVCSHCNYARNPFFYDLEKKPVCKICAIEGTRICTGCKILIPAGMGHQCSACGYSKTLLKRTKKGQNELSPFLSNTFIEFSQWLLKRRDLIFTTTHILHYLDYFIELDKLANKLNHVPSYEELVTTFSVSKTRQYLLVTIFLNEVKIITIDSTIKDDFSNLNMIERQLEKFEEGSFYKSTIKEYHQHLDQKLKFGKTSIRSMRLALSPAVILMEWCEHFGLEKPNDELLRGFLWHSPGRRAGLVGFINFLNAKLDSTLKIPSKNPIVFKRPKESAKILKQKLIRSLQINKKSEGDAEEAIHIAIAYLHGIQVPNLVWIKPCQLRQQYLPMASKSFYLPFKV